MRLTTFSDTGAVYVYIWLVMDAVMDALVHSLVVYDLAIQIMIPSSASCISSLGM